MEPGYFDSLGLDDDFGTRRWLTTREEAWRLLSEGEYESEPLQRISLESNLRRLVDRDNPTSGLLGLVLRTDLFGGENACEGDDEQLMALVMSAVEAGRLVVLRETGQSANDPAAEARTEAYRIAREVNRLAKGELRRGGSRYTLAVRGQFDRSTLGATRRMLPPREARSVLQDLMLEYSSQPEMPKLLFQAMVLFVGDSAEECDLVLLRHLAQSQDRTTDQAPVTPSQIKNETSWIEIEVVDDRGEPWQRRLHIVGADGSAQEVETDEAGFIRIDIAPGITETNVVREVAALSSASQAQRPEPAGVPSGLPGSPSSSNVPSLSDLSKLSKIVGVVRDVPSVADLSKLAHAPSLADLANASKMSAALNTALNAAGLPTLPELPQIPSLPSVRDLASVATAAGALNTALNAAGLPTLPELPRVSSLPTVPSVRDLASVATAATALNLALNAARLPTLPTLPSIPSVRDLASVATAAMALNAALNVAGLPSLPELPQIPSLPNLPSIPDLPSLPNSPSAAVQSVASAAVLVGKAVDSLSAAAGIIHGGGSSAPPRVPPLPSPPSSPPDLEKT